MDITVSEINFDSDEAELKAALAVALHGPPIASHDSGGLPMNFAIRTNKAQGRRDRHDGTATLTIPDVETAQRFLALYGTRDAGRSASYRGAGPRPRKTLVVRFRELRFTKKGKGVPLIKLVAELERLPYVDPRAQLAEKKLIEDLEPPSPFSGLQFGRRCREKNGALGVFSIEWDCRFREREKPLIVFDVPDREIEIMFNRDFPEWARYALVIPWNRVIAILWDDGYTDNSFSALFHLETPPAFERRHDTAESKVRQKTSFLDFQHDVTHEQLAPYISHTLRILFDDIQSLRQFQSRCRTISLPIKDGASRIKAARCDLFSELGRVQAWLASLDLRVALQCAALYMNCWLDPKELLSLEANVYNLMQEHGTDITRVVDILSLFGDELKASMRLAYPATKRKSTKSADSPKPLLQCFKDAEKASASNRGRQPARSGLMRACSLVVTPTAIHVEGPYMDQSNRVLRMFSQHQHFFLRLKFADEDHLQIRKDHDIDTRAFVADRVGAVLRDGVTIAGRHFEFLAYSLSALREHSVWMVAPFTHPTHGRVSASFIRQGLGDFSKVIFCPARYGARLAQAFSATEPSIVLKPENVEFIPDIERFNSLFTDGVGTMSQEVVDTTWSALIEHRPRQRVRNIFPPSVYQFRFGGFKGALCVDPSLKGLIIRLRPSMNKFDAPDSLGLEIAKSFESPMPFFLNRPLIMILDCLGVPADVFLELQRNAVEQTQLMTTKLLPAARMLDMYTLSTAFRMSYVLRSIHNLLGMDFDHEDPSYRLSDSFLVHALSVGKCNILRDLRFRARIPVPQSWTLVGVADEYGILKDREIYACVQNVGEAEPRFLAGRVLVTRSPAMGQGDVQLLDAVGRPPPDSPFLAGARPIANCVVFSVQGTRSVPSMLGGGDLDGDIFNLVQYETLFPSKSYPPDDYDPAELQKLDRPCTIDDVADFVVDYINSDVIGLIANSHLVIADQEARGIFHPECMELSKLYGLALDFTKTGAPVSQDDIPRPRLRIKPDYMATEFQVDKPSTKYYPSQRVLGYLFREPDLQVDPEDILQQDWQAEPAPTFDLDPLYEKVRALVSQHSEPVGIGSAFHTFKRFTDELRHICSAYALSAKTGDLQESEVVMGTILAKTSQTNVRRDRVTRLRVQTNELVHWLRDDLAAEEDGPQDNLQRAWTAWEFAREQGNKFGAKSFGLVALGTIFECVEEIVNPQRPRARARGSPRRVDADDADLTAKLSKMTVEDRAADEFVDEKMDLDSMDKLDDYDQYLDMQLGSTSSPASTQSPESTPSSGFAAFPASVSSAVSPLVPPGLAPVLTPSSSFSPSPRYTPPPGLNAPRGLVPPPGLVAPSRLPPGLLLQTHTSSHDGITPPRVASHLGLAFPPGLTPRDSTPPPGSASPPSFAPPPGRTSPLGPSAPPGLAHPPGLTSTGGLRNPIQAPPGLGRPPGLGHNTAPSNKRSTS